MGALAIAIPAICALLAACPALAETLRVDRCLDAGGRWDAGIGACVAAGEGAAPRPPR